MYLVGVTGGIGSGKSTVARRLATHGVAVIDVDGVAREVVEPGQPALAEIAARFGSDLLRPDGSLDRQGLALRAFSDEASRRDLERITHPRVAALVAERLQRLAAEDHDDPGRIVVLDHPLLLETGQVSRVDVVVVVLAEEELRVRRLVEDRGMDEGDVRARIRQQASDAERRAVADHVVVNEQDLADLYRTVDALYATLAADAQGRAQG